MVISNLYVLRVAVFLLYNLNFSRMPFLSDKLFQSIDIQYSITNGPQIELANKESMIWRVRSCSGYRNVMRYIVSFLISWLWLKSYVQYEIKNLPPFYVQCVRLCLCICTIVKHILFSAHFDNGVHCNSLKDIKWSQHSKWPIDNLGQLKGCPVI